MARMKPPRGKTAGRGIALATRANEKLLCDPQSLGDIERAYPRVPDAWSMTLPDLTSLPRATRPRRPTRFCIATEDIVGPVRNGGIGTTYAALAEMLAGRGHDVTILYLKGEEVENETIGHWVDFYAARGVKFVPVTNYANADDIVTNADQWMRPVYNMYRWLIDHPMDVVHVSEWRGSAYMCLAAKRQGIAFADTLFIVKTSSPWLWNRMYGSYPIDRLADLSKTLAERRSVELADMVIGGSLHLLRWMASQGYVIPRARAFVQPNVVLFAHLKDLAARRNLKPGRRVPIDEIVFFGRLEARKGLLTFCQAIRRLLKLGHKLPARITFMGKGGARLAVRPHQTVVEYIEEETADWPAEVSILTDFQQQEAIGYLLDGARLAVMPSTIENSSLAVYEAAICHIPFIASDTGGTSELVAARDAPHVLCDPHPIPLAAKLATAIDEGAYVARASFDNDENLRVWNEFHDDLACGLKDVLLRRASPPVKAQARKASVDVAVFSRGNPERLERTLASLAAQDLRPRRVLVAIDAAHEAAACEHAVELASRIGLACEVVPTLDYDAGYALNEVARRSRARYIAFLQSGWTLTPPALATLEQVARRRKADVLSWFFRLVPLEFEGSGGGQLVTEMIGGPAETLYLEQPRDMPLFVRREAFDQLGGFTVDYRVPLHEREFISKAIVCGLTCETVTSELGSVVDRDVRWLEQECYDVEAGEFRILRPYLAALPLAMREVVLAGNGLQRRLPKRGRRQHQSKGERGRHRIATNAPTSPDALISLIDDVAGRNTLKLVGLAASREKKVRQSHTATGLFETLSIDPELAGPLPRHLQLFSGWGGLHAEDGDRYFGRVLDIAAGAVIGWVVDRADPERPVIVEAQVNGRRVGSSAADLHLPSVHKQPDVMKGHGFRIPLFDGLLAKLMSRNRPVSVDVLTADRVVLARGLPAHRQGLSIRRSAFEGYLDAVTDATIRGWVWMPGDPARRLDVTVYLDGRFYSRLRADTYRADIADHNIGSGDYAFSLRIPERFRVNDAHQVDVFIADTGIRLRGSPVLIGRNGQSLAVA